MINLAQRATATVASGTALNGEATGRRNETGFTLCPSCNSKQWYHVRSAYERCRSCGYFRLLLPGQDF